MSIYEANLSNFNRWESDLITRPPEMDELADAVDPDEASRCVMERMQLELLLRGVNERLETLGMTRTPQYHSIPRQDGFTAVYTDPHVRHRNPDEPFRFIHVAWNDVSYASQDIRQYLVEDYFLDTQLQRLTYYAGKALVHDDNPQVPRNMPTIVTLRDGRILKYAGANYRPLLPQLPSTLMEYKDFNVQRQRAAELFEILRPLNDVSREDIIIEEPESQ